LRTYLLYNFVNEITYKGLELLKHLIFILIVLTSFLLIDKFFIDSSDALKTEKTKEVVTESKRKESEEISTERKESNEPVEKASTIILAGENGVLANDAIIALGEDKTNFDELMNYVVAKNTQAVDRMIAEGRAVIHPKGTSVTVVESDFAAFKIEVIETGERGWVPYEFVTKK
jgi:hypothetical protein